MQNSLREALNPVFTIDVTGNANADKKLCLLPGIYDTMKLVQDTTTKAAALTFGDAANLNAAGYTCDLVADDSQTGVTPDVVVSAIGRAKYRDFLNEVRRVGMKCTEIMIQNLGNDDNLFSKLIIEVAKTVVGARGGMDFITLQKYKNANAYDRSFIRIDLSGLDEHGNEKALWLTPEVFMAINVPEDAHFTMQFTFEGSVSGLA